MTIEAGASRVDITPRTAVPLAGYQRVKVLPGGPKDHVGYVGRTGLSTGVHDPLFARALVLQDGLGALVALVALDVCIVTSELTERVRAEALSRWDIDPQSILIFASHTHGGPDYCGYWESFDDALERDVEMGALAAIESAFASKRPAAFGWSRGELSTPIVNRRHADRPTDPTVTVLKVEDDSGTCLAVGFSYACHPIVVGPQDSEVTADYPGQTAAMIERELAPECVALFLPGAGGNINPVAFPYEDREDISKRAKRLMLDGREVSFRSHAEAKRLGLALGGEVLRVAMMMETQPCVRLGTWRQVVDVSLKESTELETFLIHDAISDRFAERLRGRRALQTEVQACRLGDLVLVGLPGEPFVEIGIALQEIPADSGATVRALGYTNDYPGYVMRADDYRENRYETLATPLDVDGAGAIIKAAYSVRDMALSGSFKAPAVHPETRE